MASVTCLLLLAMLLGTADAEAAGFGELDRDRDGRLSPREVVALPLNFQVLDANQDGYLSRRELQRLDNSQTTKDREPATQSSSDGDLVAQQPGQEDKICTAVC